MDNKNENASIFIRCLVLVSALATFLISGCSDNATLQNLDDRTLKPFNLSDITADQDGDRMLEFSWSSAIDSSGVAYTLCKKDDLSVNQCDPIITVSEELSTKVKVEDLVAAMKAEYFVLAVSDGQRLASSEKTVDFATLANIVATADLTASRIELSEDGNTVAISNRTEDGDSTGVTSSDFPSDASGTATNSGAVYILNNRDGKWTQTAYIKASNAGAGDLFGWSISVSGDGSSLAVGALQEDNSVTGIFTDSSETSETAQELDSGAVYLFELEQDTWIQTAYIKASNAGIADHFGVSVALNYDGSVLAVGADLEDGSLSGVITDESEKADSKSLDDSGAVYVFEKAATQWTQVAYLKASRADPDSRFGLALSLDDAGDTLLVGSPWEKTYAEGVIDDGSETTISASDVDGSGAAYLFEKEQGVWKQNVFIKSFNPSEHDRFGYHVELNGDGNVIAISSPREGNGATGVSSDVYSIVDQGHASDSGAAYVYKKQSGSWERSAYFKPSRPNSVDDAYGRSLALSNDGKYLAVGTDWDDVNTSGIVIDGAEVTLTRSLDSGDFGAIYLYKESTEGMWEQQAYVKALKPVSRERFGSDVALNADGTRLFTVGNKVYFY